MRTLAPATGSPVVAFVTLPRIHTISPFASSVELTLNVTSTFGGAAYAGADAPANARARATRATKAARAATGNERPAVGPWGVFFIRSACTALHLPCNCNARGLRGHPGAGAPSSGVMRPR